MEKRRIGSLEVSAVGLGCNNFGRRLDEPGTQSVVESALDMGIDFFDTADTYGGTDSEVFLGRALGTRRRDVIVATKFGWEIDEARRGAHPEYVKRAIEDSLVRLGTDTIDLYQLHKPDDSVPIADTLGVLDDLVTEGKVREIGCSNFSAEQLVAAREASGDRARFVSVQNEYSLLRREAESEVLPECERQNLSFLPYFPLASGLLTGKFRLGQAPPAGTRLTTLESMKDRLNDEALAVVEGLIEFARDRGHTVLELAFAWLLAKDNVSSVIAGAMKPEQVRQNATAASWSLTSDDCDAIDALLSPPSA